MLFRLFKILEKKHINYQWLVSPTVVAKISVVTATSRETKYLITYIYVHINALKIWKRKHVDINAYKYIFTFKTRIFFSNSTTWSSVRIQILKSSFNSSFKLLLIVIDIFNEWSSALSQIVFINSKRMPISTTVSYKLWMN